MFVFKKYLTKRKFLPPPMSMSIFFRDSCNLSLSAWTDSPGFSENGIIDIQATRDCTQVIM